MADSGRCGHGLQGEARVKLPSSGVKCTEALTEMPKMPVPQSGFFKLSGLVDGSTELAIFMSGCLSG